jgi:hypothetical protein
MLFGKKTDFAGELPKVLDAHPDLCYEGFGLGASAFGLEAAATADQLKASREKLLAALAEVEACGKWLKKIKKTDEINDRHASGGLKHCVTRCGGGYVSNGALIAAAIILGFDHQVLDGGPNTRFNVSDESVTKQVGIQ